MPTPDTLLVAVAAPNEARAILAALGLRLDLAPWRIAPLRDLSPGAATPLPRADLLLTGVGKAAAAGAVARAIDPARHRGVLSLGVAGALPGSRLAIGQSLLASACVFADEGVETPDGYTDLSARGFPPGPWTGPGAPTDSSISAPWSALADRTGPVATVSTCSGTDARAATLAARTGALAEAMEGAAVAASAARLGLPFAEFRVISNTTGSSQQWDLPLALARLGDLARAGLSADLGTR